MRCCDRNHGSSRGSECSVLNCIRFKTKSTCKPPYSPLYSCDKSQESDLLRFVQLFDRPPLSHEDNSNTPIHSPAIFPYLLSMELW